MKVENEKKEVSERAELARVLHDYNEERFMSKSQHAEMSKAEEKYQQEHYQNKKECEVLRNEFWKAINAERQARTEMNTDLTNCITEIKTQLKIFGILCVTVIPLIVTGVYLVVNRLW